MYRSRAFTLAELLIALAILGVIATFTIPKVLQGQQDTTFKSIEKETAASVAQAYQTYQLTNTVVDTTGPKDLTPYLNYAKLDTVSGLVVDDVQNATTQSCTSPRLCFLLHNGAILHFTTGMQFAGSGSTNAFSFMVDPDGKVTTDGSASGPGKSVKFFMYRNGMLRTRGTVLPNTYTSSDTGINASGGLAADPPWFSWD